MLLIALLIVGLVGCQGSTDAGAEPPPAQAQAEDTADDPDAAPSAAGEASGGSEASVPDDTSEPAAAVTVFLDALRRGDDQKILEMYTVRAREEAARLNEHFAPRGSDTAEFQVGEVEYLGDDGARVACRWTDLDQNGQPHTMQFQWTMRREPRGWRVAGMIATPFPGEDPVLLDFENLDETIRKVNLLADEIRRREEGPAEPEAAKKSEAPVLR